jgi:hypothetical protein
MLLADILWPDDHLEFVDSWLAGWIAQKPHIPDVQPFWNVVLYPPDQELPPDLAQAMAQTWDRYIDEAPWDPERAAFVRDSPWLPAQDYEEMRWWLFLVLSELGDKRGLRYRSLIWHKLKGDGGWRLKDDFREGARTSVSEVRAGAKNLRLCRMFDTLCRGDAPHAGHG